MKINGLDIKDVKQKMLKIQKQADKYALKGIAYNFGDSTSDFWSHFKLIKSDCGIWYWDYTINTLEEDYFGEITPFQYIHHEDDDVLYGNFVDSNEADEDMNESDKVTIEDDYTTTNRSNNIVKAQNLLNKKMNPILKKLNK